MPRYFAITGVTNQRKSVFVHHETLINGDNLVPAMGGAKKKSAAQMEKQQDADKTKKEGHGKKDKKQDKVERKAAISVIVNEDQAIKLLKTSNFITAQELARQTGVKISAANACLVGLTKKGAIKRTGGFSGHWIYQPDKLQ